MRWLDPNGCHKVFGARATQCNVTLLCPSLAEMAWWTTSHKSQLRNVMVSADLVLAESGLCSRSAEEKITATALCYVLLLDSAHHAAQASPLPTELEHKATQAFQDKLCDATPVLKGDDGVPATCLFLWGAAVLPARVGKVSPGEAGQLQRATRVGVGPCGGCLRGSCKGMLFGFGADDYSAPATAPKELAPPRPLPVFERASGS